MCTIEHVSLITWAQHNVIWNGVSQKCTIFGEKAGSST